MMGLNEEETNLDTNNQDDDIITSMKYMGKSSNMNPIVLMSIKAGVPSGDSENGVKLINIELLIEWNLLEKRSRKTYHKFFLILKNFIVTNSDIPLNDSTITSLKKIFKIGYDASTVFGKLYSFSNENNDYDKTIKNNELVNKHYNILQKLLNPDMIKNKEVINTKEEPPMDVKKSMWTSNTTWSGPNSKITQSE